MNAARGVPLDVVAVAGALRADRMARATVQIVLDFFAGKLDPALDVNKAAPGGIKGAAE